MAAEGDEPRRAAASFARLDAHGTLVEDGHGTAVVDDDRLTVGPVVVAHLDADAVRAEHYQIQIDLWPAGRVIVAGLGRRFDTFAGALAQARNHARVVGLLAHGLGRPEVFEGAVLDAPTPGRAGIHVYDTHVTLVPETGLPWQVPFGAVTTVERLETPPAVVLCDSATTTIGWLARHHDAFLSLVSERVHAQRRLLVAVTGQEGFADGLGLPRSSVQDFDRAITRVTAPERAESARAVLAAANAEPRLGFVKLLDPDGETLAAPSPLPENWASFVLAPVGGLTVLEILSGPSAATYVFRAPIDAVNRDLQALHFRRAPLALRDEDARLTPDNPLRLALRALDPLRRLRDATTARVVHGDGGAKAFQAAIAAAP
jgi:hypothetical protein